MQQICLITAPIATDFEDASDAASSSVREAAQTPQLGVLSLAGVLDRLGIRPQIFNTDRAYYEYLMDPDSNGLAAFADWAARRVVASKAGIFGFSSICSSYPLTIRMAESVKRHAPGCTILLGGPQASVVDLPTLEAFPFVDLVLRGEADRTLPMLLDELNGKRRLSEVPGLAYRSAFGLQRSGDAPVIDDLDSLPLPAYHLTGELKSAPVASLELGRGCPFSCTFCSTNDFFRRKFRVKSPERMLADMRAIASQYGFRSFDLVHDMFTVDRRRVVAFCERMIESGEGFGWSCSARTDCVDEELLELMARAGCEGIFFGVETGSRRMQRIIDKDLDPDQAKRVIEIAERHGLSTTVSLITGFPEENQGDLQETVGMYMHSMRHAGSNPQLNILAPLAGTPIYSKYRDQMVLEDLCSDMSHQGRVHNDADRELIRNYPAIFPNFYMLQAPGLDRAGCIELREFLLMGTVRLRWLLTAIHQSSAGMLDVFFAWRMRRMEIHPDLSGGSLRHYYASTASRNEFTGFVRSGLADSLHPAVEALVAYHEASLEAAARNSAVPPPGKPVSAAIMPNDMPARKPGTLVLESEWDIQGVIESLKRGQPAGIRMKKYYRIGLPSEQDSRLIEITPLLARALQVCDGRRTVAECASELSGFFDYSEDLRQYAVMCLFKSMRSEGLIEIYRAAAPAFPRLPAPRRLPVAAQHRPPPHAGVC